MRGLLPVRGLALSIALSLGSASLAADGIQSKTIQFAKGASSATVKGSIQGRQTIDYKLRAKAGQTMTVNLKSGNPGLAFNVLPPGSKDVAIEGAIGEFLREALGDDLRAAGHHVGAEVGGTQISGEVLRFWVRTDTTPLYWDVVAQMELRLALRPPVQLT